MSKESSWNFETLSRIDFGNIRKFCVHKMQGTEIIRCVVISWEWAKVYTSSVLRHTVCSVNLEEVPGRSNVRKNTEVIQ